MTLDTPYLTQQIIAYIGNKRRLLPLIYKAVSGCAPEPGSHLRFLDLFAGSGAVSRLAKQMGFQLICNDWEQYSYVLNSGYIQTNPEDISRLFGSRKSFSTLLEELNNLPDPSRSDQYMARFYAPRSFDIEKADFRTERLFYTRKNALILDRIRNYIEDNFSGEGQEQQKNILLAILLYQAATHTNTSGVFKAYHKGFGGHGRDAMKRIISPITMIEPILVSGSAPVHVFKEDANDLVRSKGAASVDLAYLDPPYNQHQYGSNYHILNTLALWDRIPVPLDLNDKGVLKVKAGIRQDWRDTRSEYCYRDPAAASFSDLMEHIDARHILISYSTDGTIPFEQMKDICASRGELSIVTNEYTTYRGGKQSNSRRNSNIEFVLVVDTDKKSRRDSLERVDAVIGRKKLLLLFKQKFSSQRLQSRGLGIEGSTVRVDLEEREVVLETRDGFELYPPQDIYNFTSVETDSLYEILSSCICQTIDEELSEVLIHAGSDEKGYYIRQLPRLLKKLAHKKNRDLFLLWLERIRKEISLYPDLYSPIKVKIASIENVARRRFEN